MVEKARLYDTAHVDKPHPDKGHDRTVAVERSGSFAVFDGAGDAQASALAARIFQRHSSRRQPPGLPETFKAMQGAIRRRHPYFVARAAPSIVGGRPGFQTRREAVRDMLGWHYKIGLTTATAARLETDEENDTDHKLAYAHAGDSALYLFDRKVGRLDRLTEDEASSGTFQANASNFLGSERHVLRQIGSLTLPPEATIAVVTDGVNSSGWQGNVGDARLGEILSEEADASWKAAALMTAVATADDASAIVIEYRAQ